jgi:uncharacterized protein DUF6812
MQIRRVRVQIDTERLRISGVLQLPTEGYRSRTTDFLNGHDTGFIALTDAEMLPIDGSPGEQREYVAVGCRHVIALAELEDLGIVEEDERPPLPGINAPSVPPPAA